MGPCSIHDIEAAKEYSEYIQNLRNYKDKLEILCEYILKSQELQLVGRINK